MLDLRKKIFIIVSVFVSLVLIFVLLYLFVFNRNINDNESLPSYTNVPFDISDNENTFSQKESRPIITNEFGVAVEKDASETYIKQISRIFTERFFTFSNQNSNQHIEDVVDLTTPSMQKWVKKQKLIESENYSGLTTRVITANVDKITENSATVVLEVQQTIRENGLSNVEYKTGRVELILLVGDWKVNAFYWD